MIVDSSAIIAILKREPEAAQLSAALDVSQIARISAANLFESAMVVDRWRNPTLSRRFDELLDQFQIIIEPVTAEQAHIARQAYRDYGKGSGHPANLNFGDCFSYALARAKREPILFKGDDFGHTDLRSAVTK
jgi:ribonuclease VapC